MEYLDLYDEEPLKDREPKKLIPKDTVKIEIPEIDLPSIFDTDKKDRDTIDDMLAATSCGVAQFYGDESKEGYFKRENLFSELVSGYQKAAARHNLGIGDPYSLVWGNIYGNIGNQKDLKDMLNNSVLDSIEYYTTKINAEIARAIRAKANILDPKFEGRPTVPTPDVADNSQVIANTEWVKMVMGDVDSAYLRELKLSKDHMFIDDSPQQVVLSWSFHGEDEGYNDVDEVFVNGVKMKEGQREYTFVDVEEAFIVHFYYKVHGEAFNKYLPFRKVPAIYYGFSSEKETMEKTAENQFIVDLDEGYFVYLRIPQDNNARIAVDNIYGGFENVTDLEGDDDDADGTVQYYLYKSVNSGLGLLHINYAK